MRSPHDIALAVTRLREGGLVAFPTETVYGLGADALSEAAVRGVFLAKGRPSNNPLIVHVSDEAMARRTADHWPDAAHALAQRFWPGPLTIVVPKAAQVPSIVTGGGDTVGLRCPDHPLALALIEGFDGPLVGPSANRSGMLSPTTADHVRRAFPEELVMVLDGGPCRAGIESTVVSVAGPVPIVLRRGVIGAEEIASVLGVRVNEQTSPGRDGHAQGPLPSPGMLDKHYAPQSRTVLFDADQWPEVIDEADGPAVVLSHERSRHASDPHRMIRMPMDAPGYAAFLYAALHEADAMTPALIAIERPRAEGALWDAIRDRLARATAPD